MKLDPRARVDPARVARMGDSLAHRGPDGVAHQEHPYLGVSRLAKRRPLKQTLLCT